VTNGTASEKEKDDPKGSPKDEGTTRAEDDPKKGLTIRRVLYKRKLL
jgi:hypothetical protein